MLNLSNEIWKDISGFEGRYQVSTHGRIKSIQDNHGNNKEAIRSTFVRSDTCQYEYVQLWVKDTPTTKAVHRLVAQAFIENPEDKPVVNHIDGNRLNNNVCNLEWVSQSENLKHAYASGFREPPKAQLGKKCGNTSNFHNVTWDTSRNKWKATLKHKGKMLFQKRFENEIDAALYVNKMLDELGFDDRPRNIIE